MWEPMLQGKFGPYYKDVNMAWMWARFHARTSRLGTYEGGFQAFVDDFADQLRNKGVDFRLTTPVREITETLLVKTGEQEQRYDRVLVTTSPRLLSFLVPSLPENYQSGLKNLKSMGAVVVILALKHQLSEQGYYWFNLPKEQGFPFLALVEHTNYLTPAYFGGDHIVYCGDYRVPEHEYFTLSKEELLDRFLPSLARINPGFDRDWVRKTWVFRAKYAQPVPEVNHSKNIPPLATPVEGLYFASMSQVYPWDRGTNFAVEIGRRAARLMLDP
jgi:protoporphyrinogen oxidase